MSGRPEPEDHDAALGREFYAIMKQPSGWPKIADEATAWQRMHTEAEDWLQGAARAAKQDGKTEMEIRFLARLSRLRRGVV